MYCVFLFVGKKMFNLICTDVVPISFQPWIDDDSNHWLSLLTISAEPLIDTSCSGLHDY